MIVLKSAMIGIILLRSDLVLRKSGWLCNYIQKCISCKMLFCVLPIGFCLCMCLCLFLQLSLANCIIASAVFCMSACLCRQLFGVLCFDGQWNYLSSLMFKSYVLTYPITYRTRIRGSKDLQIFLFIFTLASHFLLCKIPLPKNIFVLAYLAFSSCSHLEIKCLHMP